ncbi:uncharacterized protein THITE_2032143, partial [Thermothielavioides terrestris NRRL 8126]
RRKAHSRAACETCRKRRVKCNAARPCSYCASAGINCVYTTSSATETHFQALKRRYSEAHERESTFREIWEHLRDRPLKEAEEILKRIRLGSQPESVLRFVREGDLLLQLAVVPERRYRYVFPFVQEMPAYLVRPDNPYLDTWIHDWAPNGAAATRQLDLPQRARSREGAPSSYYVPYHAAELVEPLLETVKPSEWTRVSSDDVLMRGLLAKYFLHFYHWIPSFQKDYFLQDMASGRKSFCSSLLVNAVLAVGSIANPGPASRCESGNLRSFSCKFTAEASRLWQMEMSSNRVRLTTLQASIALDVAKLLNAMEVLALPCWIRAVELAQRIALFGPVDDSPKQNRRKSAARTFTAWALFNIQSVISFVYSEGPRLESPPAVPLPNPEEHPDFYGQIWVRYPADPRLYTTHFPQHFYAESRLRVIMLQGWHLEKRVLECGWTSAVAQEICDKYYAWLKAWHDNLPAPLKPASITQPGHIMLQSRFTDTVPGLLPPSVLSEALNIRDTAARHLETLLRVYFLRHGFEHFGGMLTHSFVQLGAEPDRTLLTALRSTLILTAKGLYDQGQIHLLGHAVLR